MIGTRLLVGGAAAVLTAAALLFGGLSAVSEGVDVYRAVFARCDAL